MQFQTEKCFSSKDWRVAYITHILEQKPEESFIVKGKFLLKKKKKSRTNVLKEVS